MANCFTQRVEERGQERGARGEGVLTVHFDRTHINQPLHACCCRTPRQIRRAFDIHLAEFCQRIGLGVAHHMHTRSEMDHRLDIAQHLRPIRCAVDITSRDRFDIVSQLIRRSHRRPDRMTAPQQLGAKRPADKTICSGNQKFHICPPTSPHYLNPAIADRM